MTKDIVGH